MSILYQGKTEFHKNLSIVQEGSIRKLLSGTGMAREQSAINIDDLHEHVYDYSLLAMHSLLFVPEPKNILIVGLGGGVIPREMAHFYPQTKIDIAEIDPKIIELAKQYFFFKEADNLKILVGDIFIKINVLDKKYDIIIIDAFLSNYIPFYLMTTDFIIKVKNRLSDNSVLALNVCNIHPSFNNHINTIRSVLGDNIYRLNGYRNDASTMLYVVKDSGLVLNADNIMAHFLMLQPDKLEITDEIKNAKIFNLKDY